MLAMLLFAGCLGPSISDTPPPQLEAYTASNWEAVKYGSMSVQGQLSVEGSGRDWELEVDGQLVTVHSPGELDLSLMDGRDVTLSLEFLDEYELAPTLIVSDDEGPLYVGGALHFGTVEKVFGSNVVHYGELISKPVSYTHLTLPTTPYV